MLIDEFLPVYDVVERHQIDINAPVERVYPAVRTFDLSDSRVIRWLFLLRGLPNLLRSRNRRIERPNLTLDGLLKAWFILLGERPQQELLLGTVGRFWKPIGDSPQRLDVEGFRNFERPGYAKAAWSFWLSHPADGITRLAAETRVYCLDSASRRRFRLYWLFVGPFSGLTRKILLRGIKRKAERLSNVA